MRALETLDLSLTPIPSAELLHLQLPALKSLSYCSGYSYDSAPPLPGGIVDALKLRSSRFPALSKVVSDGKTYVVQG